MSGSKKKKKKRRIIIFTVEIILLLLVLAALFIWSKYQRLNHEPDIIDTDDIMNTDLDESTQEVLQGYTNIAIFGLDNRTNGTFDAGNTDTIMIASINNDTKEVKLVSVYRDSYLNRSEDSTYNFGKATEAHNMKGGVKRSIGMLNRNFDLDIKDYVALDFKAMTEAVDLLGGVEIEIDEGEAKWMDMYIHETNVLTDHNSETITEPGVYNLDGVQATAYCRIRYTSDGYDFKRAQRQREVLSKMVEKVKAAGLGTINELIDAVFEDVSTNFTLPEVVTLASQMFNYELTDTIGFPFKLKVTKIHGGDVDVPCDLATNVTELHQYLFNDYNYTPSNTVQNFSQQIIAETGLGVEDAGDTGVKADTYTEKNRREAEQAQSSAGDGTSGDGTSADGTQAGDGTDGTQAGADGTQAGVGTDGTGAEGIQ